MPESFPRYGAGDSLSAEDFNRLSRHAEALAGGRSVGRLHRIQGPQGDLYAAGPPESIWIRILGPAGDCDNGYEWEGVQGQSGSCVPDAVSDSGSGGAAYAAFEVNNRADVPVGTIVRAWESASRDGLEFEIPGIAFYSYRTECVGGRLLQYRQQVNLSGVVGDWEFYSIEGCCECSGSVPPEPTPADCCPEAINGKANTLTYSDSTCGLINNGSKTSVWNGNYTSWCFYTGGTTAAAFPSGYTHTACSLHVGAYCSAPDGVLLVIATVIVTQWQDDEADIATNFEAIVCGSQHDAFSAVSCALMQGESLIDCVDSSPHDTGEFDVTLTELSTAQDCLDGAFGGSHPCCGLSSFTITLQIETD